MYPQRTHQHILETASRKIFVSSIPDQWMPRDVTERDYGIDCFLEMMEEERDLRGHLAAIQLKAASKLEWRSEPESTMAINYPISIKNLNYWLSLKTPVFLCVADIEHRKIYFADIKRQLRHRFLDLQTHDKLSLNVLKVHELNPAEGAKTFYSLYLKEVNHELFTSKMLMLIMHWEHYLEFIDSHTGGDPFLGVESYHEMPMVHLFETTEFLANYLDIEWRIDTLYVWYEIDKVNWNDKWYRIHIGTMSLLLQQLRPIFVQVLSAVKDLILETEFSYWLHKYPMLHKICEEIDINKIANGEYSG